MSKWSLAFIAFQLAFFKLMFSSTLNTTNNLIYILHKKTCGSESQGQEEAAYMCILRLTVGYLQMAALNF